VTLVLTAEQQAEAIDDLRAVRALGAELAEVFESSFGKHAPEAHRGAEAMIAAIDRVLAILGGSV